MIRTVEKIAKIAMFLSMALCFVLLSFFAYQSKPLLSNLLERFQGSNKAGEKELIEKNKEWKWDFTSDVDADQYYPIVVLRDGYKVIKATPEVVQVGWVYEVINATSDQRNISVTYKILDSDGFEVGQDTSWEIIDKKSNGIIRGTLEIPIEDLPRMQKRTWNVQVGSYNDQYMKQNGFNRYQEAAKIIAADNKDMEVYWIGEHCKYIFWPKKDSPKAPKTDAKGKINEGESSGFDYYPLKWRYVALALEIKPNNDLINAFTKLDKDINGLNGQGLDELIKTSNFQELTQEEKDAVFLMLSGR